MNFGGFVSEVVDNANAVLAFAIILVVTYFKYRYLMRRQIFAMFSVDVFKAMEDFDVLARNLKHRYEIANDVKEDCVKLKEQAYNLENEVKAVFYELKTQSQDKKTQEWKSFISNNLKRKYPDFYDDIDNNFDKLIDAEFFNIDLLELNAVLPPIKRVNILLQQMSIQFPSFKYMDLKKLSFLGKRQTNIPELYDESKKYIHLAEEYYNLLSLSLNDVKLERAFISNLATYYINLYDVISRFLLPKINKLIRENNKIRAELRLKALPESTFKVFK